MLTNLLGHNCQRCSGGSESGWKRWKVGASLMRWRESGGVSLKTFKTEKHKIGLSAQTPLITSWFRENIWLNASNSAFSKSLHENVGGQKHFLKGGVCGPLILPPAPAGLIFKRHVAKITWPGHYTCTNVVDIHL
jgi:hypothetical protein